MSNSCFSTRSFAQTDGVPYPRCAASQPEIFGRPRLVNVREVLKTICYPAVDRLPVAGVAEGPAAEEHSVLLLHAVGLAYDRVAQPGHLPAQLLLDR